MFCKKDKMSERIIIVNEQDEPIGIKDRADILPDDIYRVSALWLENIKGECLIARRAFTKRHDPGLWGPAVAGTVGEGETYESNIRKESLEEIGLELGEIILGKKLLYTEEHKFFAQWFFTKVGASKETLKFNPAEVAEIRWVPRDVLGKWIREKPGDFTPHTARWPELFDL